MSQRFWSVYGSVGTFSSSTITVMMIASTPSLNASSLLVDMARS